MVGVLPVFGGHRREQGLFYGQGRLAGGDAGPVADPEDVGIHRNGGLPELGIEDDIGGFTADAGERFQRLPVCGHLAIMQGQQLPGQGMHMPGLGVEQSQTMDVGLDAVFTEGHHRLGIRCHRKERPGAGVDGFVRTLRGEHHGDQKLKGGVVDQLGFRFGNGGAQGRKTAMNILWVHAASSTATMGAAGMQDCGVGDRVYDPPRHRSRAFRRDDNGRSPASEGGDVLSQRRWPPQSTLHGHVPERGACRGPAAAGYCP